MSDLFPDHCVCGCPIKGTYDEDTKHPWASYECETEKAAKGTIPLDNGSMTYRTDLCRYISALRKSAGLTPSRAAGMWAQ